MNKKELGKEILENMDLTKEQYMELCRLCDELELEKGRAVVASEQVEQSWDEILGQ